MVGEREKWFLMCPKCGEIQADIRHARQEMEERKAAEKKFFEKLDDLLRAIANTPSTKTLLALVTLVAMIGGIVATLIYYSHRDRMASLEAAQTAINLKIDKNQTDLFEKIDRLRDAQTFGKAGYAPPKKKRPEDTP
jgi:vacuolar-type H+-ATPase subunit E/Vma4